MSEGDRIGFFLKTLFIHSFPTSHCGLAGRSHACFELVSITFRVLAALQPPLVPETFFLSHLAYVAAHSGFPRARSLPLQSPALPSFPLSGRAHPNASPERNIVQTET